MFYTVILEVQSIRYGAPTAQPFKVVSFVSQSLKVILLLFPHL
jgi:hypothetical protein